MGFNIKLRIGQHFNCELRSLFVLLGLKRTWEKCVPLATVTFPAKMCACIQMSKWTYNSRIDFRNTTTST